MTPYEESMQRVTDLGYRVDEMKDRWYVTPRHLEPDFESLSYESLEHAARIAAMKTVARFAPVMKQEDGKFRLQCLAGQTLLEAAVDPEQLDNRGDLLHVAAITIRACARGSCNCGRVSH